MTASNKESRAEDAKDNRGRVEGVQEKEGGHRTEDKEK